MNWMVVLTRPAKKELSKIPSKDLKYIEKALSGMQSDPFLGDVVRLAGLGDSVRRRVGNWRIFFDVDFDKRMVIVLSVVRRASNTY